jgi:quercetin dioxygenase-like cupin family protein
MAHAGKEIIHPITHERAVFRKVAADTHGELLQQDVYMTAGGFVVFEHVHQYQSERFQVKEGAGKVKINGVVNDLKPGDDITIPAGTPHIWWNASDNLLHVLVENLFETVTGLAEEGKVSPKSGLPPFLQSVMLMHHYFNEMTPTVKKVPRWALKIAFTVLYPVGRLFGYKAVYPKYLD